MKKMTFLFPFSFLLIATLIFSACKKGDVGPQGPAGPAGPTGNPGPKGDAGTANVIYSPWLDVTFQEDVANPGNWGAQINAATLTADILNKGEIKVYINAGTSASPAVFALPLEANFFILPYFQVGKINLISDIDASTGTVTGGLKDFQYRYVLIPGVVPGRMATINWNNYNEVKTYLGLKD